MKDEDRSGIQFDSVDVQRARMFFVEQCEEINFRLGALLRAYSAPFDNSLSVGEHAHKLRPRLLEFVSILEELIKNCES